MNNKRGLWFGEETGKIVLAVIGIVLMIILMFKLIGLLIQRTEYEQAKVAIEEIEDTINSLREGEVGYAFIEGPKNWLILVYSKRSDHFNQIPAACTTNSDCVCLCKERDKKNCETEGICKKFDKIMLDMNEKYVPERTFSEFFFNINRLEHRTFKMEKTPVRLAMLRVGDKVLIVPSYSDKKVIYPAITQPNNPTTAYLYINVGGKFEPIQIPYISLSDAGKYSTKTQAIRIDGIGSIISPSIDKQKEMLRSRKVSLSLTPDRISQLKGNLKIYIILNGEDKRKIHLSDSGTFFYDCIGEVSPDGYIWLSKDVLEDLFDIDSKLVFYMNENKKVITSDLGLFPRYIRIYERRRQKIYKTNLWTGIKFE